MNTKQVVRIVMTQNVVGLGQFPVNACSLTSNLCQLEIWRVSSRVPEPEPKPEETPFDRFKKLTEKVVSVPRSEIQKREADWQKEKVKNGKKNGR